MQFFDLDSDPWESTNLADSICEGSELRQIMESLASALFQWMKNQGDFLMTHKMPIIPAPHRELDAENSPIAIE